MAASLRSMRSCSIGRRVARRCGWIALRRAGSPRRCRRRCEDDDGRWSAGVARLETLQERAATDLRIAPLLTLARPSGAMGERLTQAALDLGRGVRAGRLDAMRDAAARLVGLGQGLTPAGDDFLCGFLAAGCCRRAAGLARAHLLTSFAEAVRELLGQTTEISASFLRDALAGRISRRWRRSPRRARARRGAISTAHCGASPPSATAPAWTPRRASSTARSSGARRFRQKVLWITRPRLCGRAEPRAPLRSDNPAPPTRRIRSDGERVDGGRVAAEYRRRSYAATLHLSGAQDARRAA